MSSNPQGTQQQRPGTGPRLRPTNPATLIVAALVAAALGWLIIARNYGDFPDLTWLPAIITGGLGLLEIIAAVATALGGLMSGPAKSDDAVAAALGKTITQLDSGRQLQSAAHAGPHRGSRQGARHFVSCLDRH